MLCICVSMHGLCVYVYRYVYTYVGYRSCPITLYLIFNIIFSAILWEFHTHNVIWPYSLPTLPKCNPSFSRVPNSCPFSFFKITYPVQFVHFVFWSKVSYCVRNSMTCQHELASELRRSYRTLHSLSCAEITVPCHHAQFLTDSEDPNSGLHILSHLSIPE